MGKDTTPVEIPEGVHVTYQFQYRKCGKPLCKQCHLGPGHGPYWYGYFRQNGQYQCKYFGRRHPKGNRQTMPLVGK